jgi:hypothetical protein
LLFKKTSNKSHERKFLKKDKVKIGDFYEIPPHDENALFIKFDYQRSLLSEIINLFYKYHDNYLIEVEYKSGTKEKYKFILANAARGFLLKPFAKDNLSVLSIKDSNDSNEQVTRLRVVCEKDRFLCINDIFITLETISSSFKGNQTGLDYELLHGKLYDFNLKLIKTIQPMNPQSFQAYGKKIFYMFHAPSLLELRKPSGIFFLSGEFGIAHSGWNAHVIKGAGDGIKVDIIFKSIDGIERIIYSKEYDPLNNNAQQNSEVFEIKTPVDSGRIILKVDPKKNNAYDQFILRNLKLIKFKK